MEIIVTNHAIKRFKCRCPDSDISKNKIINKIKSIINSGSLQSHNDPTTMYCIFDEFALILTTDDITGSLVVKTVITAKQLQGQLEGKRIEEEEGILDVGLIVATNQVSDGINIPLLIKTGEEEK